MLALAALLDELTTNRTEARRLTRIARYLAATPDPDRGWGLAVLAGAISPRAIGPAAIRRLAEQRLDPALFALSLDFVGDATETLALLWPARPGAPPPPPAEAIAALAGAKRAEAPVLLAAWLDGADPARRYALLRLATGGWRGVISGALARHGFAAWAGLDPARVEAIWHSLAPPYAALFAWAEGRAKPPDPGAAPVFRPPMQAEPIEDAAVAALDPAAYRAEWKWDGARVQIVGAHGASRLFSRTGDDISAAFPELLAPIGVTAALDGALLALSAPPGAPGSDLPPPTPFAALRRRLDRRASTPAPRRAVPVGVRLFDILFDGAEDLRALPFDTRRARLEIWFARARPAAMDLSPLLDIAGPGGLTALREAGRAVGAQGLMLKRRDLPYRAGREGETWLAWRHAPRTVEAVLMYAQAADGSGSEVTFGVWDGAALVPVGKAGLGGADHRARVETWIRAHTIARFGPVREVEKALVLEVAFDAAEASARHKSGIVLRGARIVRPRPDKQAAEAGRLENLRALLGPR